MILFRLLKMSLKLIKKTVNGELQLDGTPIYIAGFVADASFFVTTRVVSDRVQRRWNSQLGFACHMQRDDLNGIVRKADSIQYAGDPECRFSKNRKGKRGAGRNSYQETRTW